MPVLEDLQADISMKEMNSSPKTNSDRFYGAANEQILGSISFPPVNRHTSCSTLTLSCDDDSWREQ